MPPSRWILPVTALLLVGPIAGCLEQTIDLPARHGTLIAEPSSVALRVAAVGHLAVGTVEVANLGPGEVWIDGFTVTGDAAFSVAPAAGAPALPWRLAQGEALPLSVRYEATRFGPAEAVVEAVGEGFRPGSFALPLAADIEVTCLESHPEAVHFGVTAEGQAATRTVLVTACGEEPTTITALGLAGPAAQHFTVAWAGPQIDLPLTLAPGDSRELAVTFTAPGVSADTGFEAALELALGASGELMIPLAAEAVPASCPIAVIDVQPGGVVPTMTRLYLTGSDSHGPHPIVTWRWQLSQPIGSLATLVPSANVPDPTLEVNVAGTYELSLTVVDATGRESCNTARHVVHAAPRSEGLHVELTWHTPNAPDETSAGPGTGSDLDLHLATTLSFSGEDDMGAVWFQNHNTVYWNNSRPTWHGSVPTCTLDRDATDGGGPEIITCPEPAPDTYFVGVHYWEDHGFGSAFARVRIYIDGDLRLEVADVELQRRDLWQVARIPWPDGTPELITRDDGELDIIPNFQNPYVLE